MKQTGNIRSDVFRSRMRTLYIFSLGGQISKRRLFRFMCAVRYTYMPLCYICLIDARTLDTNASVLSCQCTTRLLHSVFFWNGKQRLFNIRMFMHIYNLRFESLRFFSRLQCFSEDTDQVVSNAWLSSWVLKRKIFDYIESSLRRRERQS